MKKAKLIIVFILIVSIVVLIISKILKNNNYNIEKIGNNMNIQEIEQYILNVNTYKAKIKVIVSSNKNANYYEFEQEVKGESYTKQQVLSPEEIAGMQMIYENGILKIFNTKYNMSKLYNNYPYVSDNSLFLTSFLRGYKNSEDKKIEEKDNEIIMSYNANKSKYNNQQKLYINKSTLNPTKVEIYDVNNNKKINIIYNEIELNI